jgi:hypothetical protein
MKVWLAKERQTALIPDGPNRRLFKNRIKKDGQIVTGEVAHARGTAYVFCGAYRGIDQHLWHFVYA